MIIKRKEYKEIPWTPENIEKYRSGQNLLKHARSGKNIDGFMLIDSKTQDLIGYCAWEGDYIVALEVVSNYRRQGFGEDILKRAMKCGVRKLSVNKNNIPAISLYKKLGFKETNNNLGPRMIELEINENN